jgi:hypothetical protein
MPGVWDTAEMLIAIAGEGETAAAVAAAHAMAADCRKTHRAHEAAFWSAVAAAVLVLANPQPLIAPRLPPEKGATVHRLGKPATAGTGRGRVAQLHRLAFAERLPRERKRMLEIKRKLRAILERHARDGDKPKRDR